jgi:hypothetical protein
MTIGFRSFSVVVWAQVSPLSGMECGITVKVVVWAQVSPLSGMGCGITIWISIIFNNKKTWRNNEVHRSCKSESRQCSNEVEKEKERKPMVPHSIPLRGETWAHTTTLTVIPHPIPLRGETWAHTTTTMRYTEAVNQRADNAVMKWKRKKNGNQWSSVHRKTKYWATRILLKNRRWTQLLRNDKQFLFY